MLINYFKIAVRYLVKNRTFSLINVFGLTLGFLCFMLIAFYLHDELSFDMFHRDATRTFRILQHETLEDGTTRTVAPVAARIGPEAVKQLPEVEDVMRLSGIGRLTMGNDPANRHYETILITDANFFKFFDFKLLEGDASTALTVPDAIVITKSTAIKYFGTEAALGKRLWTNRLEMTVTGIMDDFPKNSHMQLDVIFSEATWARQFSWFNEFMASDWSSNSFNTYIKLKDGADQKAVMSKLTNMVRTNYPPDEEFRSEFSLQAMKDIHLYSDNIQGNEINANGMKPFYLYMFGAVAVLMLLIACLNYMNLSTAAAYKRTREIGTRKTLGALKSQLIAQFSGEAVVLSAASLIFAVVLLQAVLPIVNEFTLKDLSLDRVPITWFAGLMGVMLLAGLLSSLYPAFIISKVQPAEAIKKVIKLGNKSVPLRKILVIAQFSISILMVASTLVIYRQLQFMRSKELGFDLENLLVIDINSDRLRRNFESVKTEFAGVSEVQSISTSTRVPGEWKSFPITTVTAHENQKGSDMIYVGIDQDFLNTYNIKLLEGRNFTPGRDDSTKVILTKLAVEELNLTDPVGQIVEIPSVRWGGNINQLEKPFRAEVIGVCDNFHFESFRQKMMPLIFGSPNTTIQRIDYYTLKINTGNWNQTIKKLQAVNNKIDADNPLEYTFLNSRFEEFYQLDEKRGWTFLVFSCIIVLIACLGLFALVSFAIESRTKELGIRKVLGASVENIVIMLSKEFLALILVACLLALPLAYYLMKNWLQDFAYHTGLDAGTFVLSGLIALIIAFVTISFRSIKAALANPVDSLRNE
ncbi:MAG: ABC transporter permease [Bacteroidota bacterium]